MDFLTGLLGSNPKPTHWLQKIERNLFNATVIAAIVVSMAAWIYLLVIMSQWLLIAAIDALT